MLNTFSSTCQTIFSLEKYLFKSPTHFFIFLLLLVLLVSYLKNHHKDQCQDASFFLCFLLGALWFRVLFLSFNPFLICFCEWCKIGVQFHFLAPEYLVFPALFIEVIIFLSILGSLCQMLVDHICKGLFLGFQVCSIGLHVCSHASTILF